MLYDHLDSRPKICCQYRYRSMRSVFDTKMWFLLFCMVVLGGFAVGTSIVSLIDKKLQKVSIQIPESAYSHRYNKQVRMQDVKKTHNDFVEEGFVDQASLPQQTVLPAVVSPSQVSTTSSTVAQPLVQVPTPTPITVPPVLPLPLPSTTVTGAPAAGSPVPGSSAAPSAGLSADVSVPRNSVTQTQAYNTLASGQSSPIDMCLPADKASFVTDPSAVRKCSPKDQRSFINSNGSKCYVGERKRYDVDDPERLRMELELIEMRRTQISNKLNVNLNSGYRIGCNTDQDCNALNHGNGMKNVCGSDHSCKCLTGGGAFCLDPANYRDPAEMTSEERERFKMQNDLSNFTRLDYIRWLTLYMQTPNLLSDDHLVNLQKLNKGMDISAMDIPKARQSPPPTSKQYLELLDANTRMNFINSDTAGPYLASNFSDYDMFIPPKDLTDYRVINGDLIVKKANTDNIQSLTPAMTAKAS